MTIDRMAILVATVFAAALLLPIAGIVLAIVTEEAAWLWLCLAIVIFFAG